MRASRGMGAISPSKMPKRKMIKRTDNPDDVASYAKGGKVMPPDKKLAAAAKAPGKLGQRARLAEMFKKMRK